jgi:glycosyltransferase involved in cell wall biosynthesis
MDSKTREETRFKIKHAMRDLLDGEFVYEAYRRVLDSGTTSAASGIAAIARNFDWPKALDSRLALQLRAAKAIDRSWRRIATKRIIFVDVSGTEVSRQKTGIERVAFRMTEELLMLTQHEFLIYPVRLDFEDGKAKYVFAETFISDILGTESEPPEDLILRAPQFGDVVLVLDISGDTLRRASEAGFFTEAKSSGAHLAAVIYDTLPLTSPEFFPPGSHESFRAWFSVFDEFAHLLFISEAALSDCLSDPANEAQLLNKSVSVIRLGSDFMPNASGARQLERGNRPKRILRFLVVGTIEPRKGHLEVLDAFDQLWDEGSEVELVIVGREGWKGLADESRRDILRIIERIQSHEQLGFKLLWLNNLDDGGLAEEYSKCDAVIAASYAEGFGLPIIEASRNAAPVLARDIPVFREVAPDGTVFFQAGRLADAVKGFTPHTVNLSDYSSWRESAEHLLTLLKNVLKI